MWRLVTSISLDHIDLARDNLDVIGSRETGKRERISCNQCVVKPSQGSIATTAWTWERHLRQKGMILVFTSNQSELGVGW